MEALRVEVAALRSCAHALGRAARSAAEEQSNRDAQKRALAVDPLGVSGGPSWLDKPVDPAAFGHQAEELQARLALIVENYPERLKVSLGYTDGYIGEGQISYAGPGAVARGRLALAIVKERMAVAPFAPREMRYDLIGVDALHGPRLAGGGMDQHVVRRQPAALEHGQARQARTPRPAARSDGPE
jgi:hypothetical protein